MLKKICAILLSVIFTIEYVYGYSTSEYSIDIPTEYYETEKGVFENGKAGECITVEYSTTKYEEKIDFVESTLESNAKVFLDELIKAYPIEVTGEIMVNELIKIGDSYNSMHFKYRITNDKDNVYMDMYFIGSNNTIIGISVTSANEDIMNESYMQQMLSSLRINDYKQMTSEIKFNPLLLLLDFVITFLCYCGLALILRLWNGKMEYKKGRIIILINCIVVWLFFAGIKAANGIEQRSWAVFIYYFIAKAILLRPKEEQEESSNIENDKPKDEEVPLNEKIVIEEVVEEEKDEEVTEEILVEDEEEILSPKFCNQCGTKLEEKWKFCNNCGVKIRK